MVLGALRAFYRYDVRPRKAFRDANPDAFIAFNVAFMGKTHATSIGKGAQLSGPSVIEVSDDGGLTGARLTIGEETYVGEFANIRCMGTPIVIGRKCMLSQHVNVVGANHGIAPGQYMQDQPWEGTGVVIGDDVWIGAGATVLAGARIGDGAVVAAGAVVRGDVAPGSIVGGVPARVLGHRDDPGRGAPQIARPRDAENRA